MVLGRILGDRLFGQDPDKLFAYETPMVARIQDRDLGCLRMLLQLIIFVYVLIFQICYQGKHFYVEKISGTHSMTLQEPTAKHCNPMKSGCESNFTLIGDLAYCSGSQMAAPAKRLDCEYFDATDLLVEGDGFMVPTRIREYKQVPSCDPTPENGYECKRKYKFTAPEGKEIVHGEKAPPYHDVFIADIEHFTLLIDHSYEAEGHENELGGHDDYSMQGYFEDCTGEGGKCVRKPIVCVHSKCEPWMVTKDKVQGQSFIEEDESKSLAFMRSSLMRRSEAVSRKSETADIHGFPIAAIGKGDVVSIGNLLKLVGLDSLDVAHGDSSRRAEGVVINLKIHYSNIAPWQLLGGMDPPEYTIKASLRPTYSYKSKFATPTSPTTPAASDRTVFEYNGIGIVVEQTGELRVFDVTQFVIILTTALGLLAFANMGTDFIALKLMKDKEAYAKCKYRWSEDFHQEKTSSD